jgi:hypothetical protein
VLRWAWNSAFRRIAGRGRAAIEFSAGYLSGFRKHAAEPDAGGAMMAYSLPHGRTVNPNSFAGTVHTPVVLQDRKCAGASLEASVGANGPPMGETVSASPISQLLDGPPETSEPNMAMSGRTKCGSWGGPSCVLQLPCRLYSTLHPDSRFPRALDALLHRSATSPHFKDRLCATTVTKRSNIKVSSLPLFTSTQTTEMSCCPLPLRCNADKPVALRPGTWAAGPMSP